jgi:hypothetical protein
MTIAQRTRLQTRVAALRADIDVHTRRAALEAKINARTRELGCRMRIAHLRMANDNATEALRLDRLGVEKAKLEARRAAVERSVPCIESLKSLTAITDETRKLDLTERIASLLLAAQQKTASTQHDTEVSRLTREIATLRSK